MNSQKTQRTCKKCNKKLLDDEKKYCRRCKNKRKIGARNAVGVVASTAFSVVGIAVYIVSVGKINIEK